MSTMTSDCVMYAQGLLMASVCTTLSDDETLRRVNTLNHPGTSNGWQISADETFASGQPNPSPCNREAGRRHVLLEC